MCSVKPSDRLSVDSLYNCLEIEPLSTLQALRRLWWFGHDSGSEVWISHCLSLDVVGKRGRPQKTWEEVIQDDLKSWKINKEDTMDRIIGKSAVRRKKMLNWINEVSKVFIC